jgi:hypothetical protein
MSFDMQLPTSFIAMHIRQHPLGQTGGYGSDFAAQPGSYGVSLYKAGGGYFPGGMQFPKALLSDGMHRFPALCHRHQCQILYRRFFDVHGYRL